MISIVPTAEIGAMWQYLQPWLEAPVALSNGRFTTQSAYEGLLRGEFQAVFAHHNRAVDAVALTHLSEYGTGALWCDIPLMGGRDMATWIAPAMMAIEGWAAYNNCRGVQPAGRPGLEKHLAPLGYVPMARMWQKDLSDA